MTFRFELKACDPPRGDLVKIVDNETGNMAFVPKNMGNQCLCAIQSIMGECVYMVVQENTHRDDIVVAEYADEDDAHKMCDALVAGQTAIHYYVDCR